MLPPAYMAKGVQASSFDARTHVGATHTASKAEWDEVDNQSGRRWKKNRLLSFWPVEEAKGQLLKRARRAEDGLSRLQRQKEERQKTVPFLAGEVPAGKRKGPRDHGVILRASLARKRENELNERCFRFSGDTR